MRFRFGLRLLLLNVGLFATILAWRNAVVERQRHEWDLKRMPLETELERLEIWSNEGHRNLHQELSGNLARIDASIDAVKKRLGELDHRP
jgi:hypothetical protein